jgi:hypothetical protein
MLGKNYHRHIDECKNSKFEKEWCRKCKRDCVMSLENPESGEIIHKHICTRPPKKERKAKPDSIRRRKRRQAGLEKKIGPKFKNTFRVMSDAECLFLRKIIDEFVNEKRYKRIEFADCLRQGYPREFLNLYYSENYFSDFRVVFNKYIGHFGRFLGDICPTPVPFTPEKATKLREKYSSTFAFLEGTTTSDKREDILIRGKREAREFLKENPIPSHRRVKLADDLFNTYLFACAQRREIDFELGLAKKFESKEEIFNFSNNN